MRAFAQDPVKTFPANYHLLFENPWVTVIHVHYGPHEKLGVHDHPRTPSVYVYLNDSGRVVYRHYGDEVFSVTRPPTTAGSFRVSSGRIERHSIENLADVSSEFLRVELKQSPLGSLPHFRGTAPLRLSQNEDRMEISSGSGFAVRRMVCGGAAACAVEASARGSLLVAITPVNFVPRGKPSASPPSALSTAPPSTRMENGAVQWLAPEQSGSVRSVSAAPAHLLRIVIPDVKENVARP